MATIKAYTDKPKRKSYFKHNIVYCKKGDIVVTYPNVLVAEKETGVYSDRIYKCCNGKMRYAGGFAWSYTPFEEYPNDGRIWKDVEGYENLYQVSTDGLVRTSHKGLWEMLSAGRKKHGYYSVLLHKDGKRKNMLIHRLVAKAFLPNPNNYPYINHKDENPSNNHVDNLEWCTASYNNSYGEHPKKVSKAAKERTRTGKCFDGSDYLGNMVAPVLQYDLNGNFIHEFESVKEAREKYSSRVQDCLSGKTTQAGGFQWKYKTKDAYPLKIDAYVKNVNQSLCCSRPIKQLKDGVVVATYGSIKEASAKTGFDYSGIKKCLNGTYKQTFGFTWEYDDCPNYKKKVIHYGTK